MSYTNARYAIQWSRLHLKTLAEKPAHPVPLDRQKRRAYIEAHAGGGSTLQTGRVAEWLCSGLQIRVHRFDSGLGLHHPSRTGIDLIPPALNGRNINNVNAATRGQVQTFPHPVPTPRLFVHSIESEAKNTCRSKGTLVPRLI